VFFRGVIQSTII